MKHKMAVDNRVQDLIKHLQINYSDFARRCQISTQSVWLYRTGQLSPSVEVMDRMIAVMHAAKVHKIGGVVIDRDFITPPKVE